MRAQNKGTYRSTLTSPHGHQFNHKHQRYTKKWLHVPHLKHFLHYKGVRYAGFIQHGVFYIAWCFFFIQHGVFYIAWCFSYSMVFFIQHGVFYIAWCFFYIAWRSVQYGLFATSAIGESIVDKKGTYTFYWLCSDQSMLTA